MGMRMERHLAAPHALEQGARESWKKRGPFPVLSCCPIPSWVVRIPIGIHVSGYARLLPEDGTGREHACMWAIEQN